MLLFALEIRGRKFLSFKSILSHRNLLGREIDLGPTTEEYYVEEKGMMEEVRDLICAPIGLKVPIFI